MTNFGGEKLNFIQIGLGTNATFIQNLAGNKKTHSRSLHWLFQPSTEHAQDKVTGIGVEPIAHLAEALLKVAVHLPRVQVLQKAIGDQDQQGKDMFFLSKQTHDDLISKVQAFRREELTQDLEYLCNMSCLGSEHPKMRSTMDHIVAKYEIQDTSELCKPCTQKVDVWSWSTLVREFNFGGCEILLVDAEGSDAKILRSLVQHCKTNPTHWPEMIQFETMGHCDVLEGQGTELRVLETLQGEGYKIITISEYNSIVIKASAIENEEKWRNVVGEWYCSNCKGKWLTPFYETRDNILCQWCHKQQGRERVTSKPCQEG